MVSAVRPGNFKLGRFLAVRRGQVFGVFQLDQKGTAGGFEGFEGGAFTGNLFAVNLVECRVPRAFSHGTLEGGVDIGVGGTQVNGVDAVDLRDGFGYRVLHFPEFRPAGTDF